MKKIELDNLIYYEANDAALIGKNAKIDFNGATDIENQSNHITINGITMDLTGIGDFTINVATDVDAV